MKWRFLILETRSPEWVVSARAEYATKLKGFGGFEIVLIKSPKIERDEAEYKRKKEGELILKELDEKESLVLFDEAGRTFKNSEAFLQKVSQLMDAGTSKQIAFCIGGAYGFSDEVKKRAIDRWSLSGLTYNHWVAQVVALEQLYRALAIRQNLPYHNR